MAISQRTLIILFTVIVLIIFWMFFFLDARRLEGRGVLGVGGAVSTAAAQEAV